MKLKSLKKVKQQRRVVLLALYLLKHLAGDSQPAKRKVLRYITSNRLMHIPASDERRRSNSEPTWMNDLAWKRADLKDDGFLNMPDNGIWQITDHGERDVEQWAQRVKEAAESKPNWREDFKAHWAPDAEIDDDFHNDYYITEETIQWAIKIAS